MKKITSLLLILLFVVSACKNEDNNMNPLLKEFDTEYGVPPFGDIKPENFVPAYEEAIKEHNSEIKKITENTEAPDFDNTIADLDRSGASLKKINGVFFNLTEALTGPEMQEAAREINPMLSGHNDDIYLNTGLYNRVKTVYDNKDNEALDRESEMLLEEYYKDFKRAGAGLNGEEKERLREVNKRLSLLHLEFGENVLKETNDFKLVIDNTQDLSGLPEAVITGAQQAGEDADLGGKWVFTTHKPSMLPFLTYSDKRELRKELYTAYTERGNNNNENDNKEVLKEIAKLRFEKANLLGYKNYAEYVLDNNMAKTPENVYELLDKVWEPALATAKQEVKELQQQINKDGKNFKLQPWDWWYYAEKVRKEKYDLDDESLRPYFVLENVRQGIFETVNKLYGIKIEPLEGLPVYHKDVETFAVKGADGKLIGIFYSDYFPRESKRGGAWMDAYRKEQFVNGERVAPIIVNVGNFSKPAGDKPALLSLDETLTMFHEFGHALHGLLSQVKYYEISGTSVARDFVELPSQVMENWALEPEVLKTYAVHYKTGEPMPDELIEKIKKARNFNMGFDTVEYVAASYLDLAWHDIEDTTEISGDVRAYENKAMEKIGLIPEIYSRYRSTYFNHVFAGSGYATGYYSYLWAEVLDADAYAAFKETGDIFDKETAEAFRSNVLEKGGSEEPMTLYKNFRGKEPDVNNLLKRRGFKG